jgi:hypothetical protein
MKHHIIVRRTDRYPWILCSWITYFVRNTYLVEISLYFQQMRKNKQRNELIDTLYSLKTMHRHLLCVTKLYIDIFWLVAWVLSRPACGEGDRQGDRKVKFGVSKLRILWCTCLNHEWNMQACEPWKFVNCQMIHDSWSWWVDSDNSERNREIELLGPQKTGTTVIKKRSQR